MTATAFQHEMEFFPPEDTMDLASSPYRQPDDLDLDLDTMPEPATEQRPDSMFDDFVEEDDAPSETMQDNLAESVTHDNEMVDEEFTDQPFDNEIHAHRADPGQDQGHPNDDDDILYEEEEDDTPEANEPGEEIFEEDVLEEDDDDADEDDGDHLQPGNDTNATLIGENPPPKDQAAPVTEHPLGRTNLPVDATYAEAYIEANGTDHSVEETHQNSALKDEAHSSKVLNPTTEAAGESKDYSHETLDPDAQHQPMPEITGESTTDVHSAHQAESQPQEAYLHTVKVIYEENEICLFPPLHDEYTETFFLSNSSLAYESLDKLLSACREVLTGSIGDHDELVLDVASLGLHICEDSKYATQITMSQILDVYLALSHNDKIQDIEPLYCNLSSRVCLATQYAYLTASAQEGKTFSEIWNEHLGSPDELLEENEEDDVPETVHDPTQAVENASDELEANQTVEPGLDQGDHPEGFLDYNDTYSGDLRDENDVAHTGDTLTQGDAVAKYPATVIEPTGDPIAETEDKFPTQDDNPEADEILDFGNETTNAEDEGVAHEGGEHLQSDDRIPEEGLQIESTSSHTLEDEPVDTVLRSTGSEHVSYEDEEDIFEEDPAELQVDSYDGYLNDDATDGPEPLNLVGGHEDETSDISNHRELHDGAQSDLDAESDTLLSDKNVGESWGAPNGHQSPANNTVTTPLKGKTNKRKMIEEDDELDLIDLGTPDTKRRRPS